MEDAASGSALGARVPGRAIDLRVTCLEPLPAEIYIVRRLIMLL